MEQEGIVYLFTNAAMPELVKIGKTLREDIRPRMVELFNTCVPFPFDCAYAARVKNPDKVEAALHTAFAPHRVNPKREFFKIDTAQAIAIIKLLEIENITPEIKTEAHTIDPESSEAADQLKKRRPSLNFREMEIPLGSELISNSTGETAVVKSERTVVFRGEEMSLTKATRLTLGIDYSVAPTRYWSFNGRSVSEIFNETYPHEN